MHRKREFKIGKIDGVSFIMVILYIIFAIFFANTISRLNRSSKKVANTNGTIIHNRNKERESGFLFRWMKLCSLDQAKPEKLEHADTGESLAQETLPNDEEMSPASTGDMTKRRKRDYIARRIKELGFLDKMRYFGEKLERFIEDKFTRMGKFCATYPKLVLFIGLAFCFLMCLGYFNFNVEKDPIKLWSSESSTARQNKKYFDENFGPFYRITQLIIEPKESIEAILHADSQGNHSITALQSGVLLEIYQLYDRINKIVAECADCDELDNKYISLSHICHQPLFPDNPNCATQSLFQYWQNDESSILAALSQPAENSAHLVHLDNCMKNPFDSECLSSFGGPIQPFMVVGGYQSESYLNASAVIITYVVNNFLNNNKEHIAKAMAWEAEVLALLKNYTSESISVFYTTERSIEDELERESKADIKIIAISYIMMFGYLTLTLGKYSSLNLKIIVLEMKIFLALAGVMLVLLSVFSSGGLFTYLGVPATLITLEVIPFLLLAVGVDNIYVMVQTYQNDERLADESVEDQIARIVGRVGPSMLLTGTTQSAAFLISALTPMPGVRAFSLYASLAIILNFFLQITCFVVLLTLDAKREQAKRVDLFCCVKLNIKDDSSDLSKRKSFLYRFFKKIYTPLLLNDFVRPFIIFLFGGFFFACIAMCDKLKVGLNQKLPMPGDSYQIQYFEALQKHLAVGPPVYFVLKDGYNYTDTDSLRRLCGASTCESNSLQSVISAASFFPNQTYIAQSSVNWIDDYMEWLNANPAISSCCYVNKKTNKFCDMKKLTEESSPLAKDCIPCPVEKVKYNIPSKDTLMSYASYFMSQNPSRDCIKAGHAMYGNAIRLKKDKSDRVTHIGRKF